jgi:hypothetical protein
MSLIVNAALEGAITVLGRAEVEDLHPFADFYEWNCGTRAEADMRIEQAILNLEKLRSHMKRPVEKKTK